MTTGHTASDTPHILVVDELDAATAASLDSATTLGVAPFTAELLTSDQPDPDSTPGNHDPAEDDQATVNIIVACGNPDAPALSVPSGASVSHSSVAPASRTLRLNHLSNCARMIV